jgi:hypothetical protein
MPSKAQGSPSVRGRQARIRTRPAEVAGLADRIQVGREQGRIHVQLTRKYTRHIYLGDDEAAYLSALLSRELPPVTVSRIEDRQGGES